MVPQQHWSPLGAQTRRRVVRFGAMSGPGQEPPPVALNEAQIGIGERSTLNECRVGVADAELTAARTGEILAVARGGLYLGCASAMRAGAGDRAASDVGLHRGSRIAL